MRRVLFIVAIAVSLIGCASSGANFKSENIPQLEPGVTTVSDASRILGAPPVQTVVLADGSSHVYWRYITASGFTGQSNIKAAGLVFGPDGRFQRILSLSNIPLDEADRQRLQPTSGSTR